jgi:hypothetical protein
MMVKDDAQLAVAAVPLAFSFPAECKPSPPGMQAAEKTS